MQLSVEAAAVDARQLAGADLLAAMRTETRLLQDLREALAQQRAGIAVDDAGAVDAATQLVSRVVCTLDEARRRRERLVKATIGEGGTLDEVAEQLPGLDVARAALRKGARETRQDLALNQGILRRALKAGEIYLQALFASIAPQRSVYAPGEALLDHATPSGVVVNARA